MIEFKNLAKSRQDTKFLKRIYGKIFSARKNFELSVVFAPPSLMRRLNRLYRNKNKVADVLSFLLAKDEGEIFLNAALPAGEAGEKDLPFLFTHGALHLLGFDHKKYKDYKIMKQKELKILKLKK